jgi:hypothetical protein
MTAPIATFTAFVVLAAIVVVAVPLEINCGAGDAVNAPSYALTVKASAPRGAARVTVQPGAAQAKGAGDAPLIATVIACVPAPMYCALRKLAVAEENRTLTPTVAVPRVLAGEAPGAITGGFPIADPPPPPQAASAPPKTSAVDSNRFRLTGAHFHMPRVFGSSERVLA